MAENQRVSVNCGGGLGTVFVLIVLWGLVFGVTYKGVTYGIGCSCDRGVEVR